MVRLYQCLCDHTRLRILNLLLEGPLCVCHLTEILDVPQPKVSRHVRALKDTGLLRTKRCCNFTICHLPDTRTPILEANLKCLQDARREDAVFRTDLKYRRTIVSRIASETCRDLPNEIRSFARACR